MIQLNFKNRILNIDINQGIDLSIPIKRKDNVNAYGLPEAEFNTFRTEGFTGSVSENGSCNCESINILPHGNGTHTECIGHITSKPVYITECLNEFHFLANLITVKTEPDAKGNNLILASHLEKYLSKTSKSTEALIIRTLPNNTSKLKMKYSGTNAAFFSIDAIKYINQMRIKHLLIDLPSVDHENDAELKAHHEFWQYPKKTHSNKTITEMVFIPDYVKDGIYWLNLMIPAIETDAVPSRPVIYPVL